jgi:glycosidase
MVIQKAMKHSLRVLPLLLLLAACSGKNGFHIPAEPAMIGLAAPVTLPIDTGSILLQDFIVDVSQIDSVSAVAGVTTTLSANKEKLSLKVDAAKVQPLSELRIWVKGDVYSVLLKRSVKQKYAFQFDPKGKSYKTVEIAGDINNWQPVQTPLKLADGKWTTELLINPGRYAYLIVADGKWMLDPNASDSTSNGSGGFNSVLKISAGNLDKAPILHTEKHEASTITIGAENGVKEYFVMWDNYRLPAEMLKLEGNRVSITLPKEAAEAELSTVRVWAYNENGSSNDLYIPLVKGSVPLQTSQLDRTDFHKSVLYFMMVDRFNNGDKGNDYPVDDARIDFKANYQGGDLAGITQKIKDGYFKKLGINTLWVSPIVQNPQGAWQEYPKPRRWFSGYHGYWPVLETKVDTRFGTDAVLEELVTTAHANNMNVVMDFVSNHIHKENPLYKQHPDWFNSMYLADSTVNIRIWDAQRLTTWFDDFMPDINYDKPEAVDVFSDSAVYWLKKFKIDGFRHDATKHVSETFWRALTKKIKQEVIKGENRNVYQIGETFGSRELIASYIGSGMLDAQFDFNLYFDSRPVFASETESFEKVAESLNESAMYYGSHSLMGNITGNHDMPRFLYYAGGSQRPGEDEKEAGWSREIKVEDPRGYARLKMLNAFIMSIPGIPIVYYGDEIGMPGANDPDNRRMMRFEGLSAEEESVKVITSKLGNLRNNSMALSYGDTRVLSAGKNHLVLLRQYFDKVAVLCLNRSGEKMKLDVQLPDYVTTAALKANFGSQLSINGAKLSVELSPISFEIATN